MTEKKYEACSPFAYVGVTYAEGDPINAGMSDAQIKELTDRKLIREVKPKKNA